MSLIELYVQALPGGGKKNHVTMMIAASQRIEAMDRRCALRCRGFYRSFP
jgi:hypothetical protein